MVKQRTARQWASLIARYERSGLTQAAFYQRHLLALSTFGYQLRRRRAGRETPGNSPAQPQMIELAPPSDPHRVASGIGASEVRIELNAPRGVLVSIHCRSQQAGEILAQIPALQPSQS